MTTKYLIIATSFSGRLCLHLRVSLSDLETTGREDCLHSYMSEGDQVVCIIPHLCTVCCYFKSSVSVCLTFSISSLFTVLNKQIQLGETPAIHLKMHVTLQVTLWTITAMLGVMLVFIDQSLHWIMTLEEYAWAGFTIWYNWSENFAICLWYFIQKKKNMGLINRESHVIGGKNKTQTPKHVR